MKKIIFRLALVTAIILLSICGLFEAVWYIIRYILTGKPFPMEPYFFEKTFILIDEL